MSFALDQAQKALGLASTFSPFPFHLLNTTVIMDWNKNLRANDIELQDLGGGPGSSRVPLGPLNPLEFGAEVFRAKEWHRRRNSRTILILSILVALLLAATTTMSVLYYTQVAKPPEIHILTTTAFATQLVPSLATTTATLTQPTTVTSTSVTTETTRRKAKTTSVTTIITTTLYITTTQPSSSAVISSSSPPPIDKYCIPQGLYGGEELHEINGDYDFVIVNALKNATSSGLSIDNEDYLTVALISIFQCIFEDNLTLVTACKQGYFRDIVAGIECNGPPYAILPSVVPVTPITETTVKDVVVTSTRGQFNIERDRQQETF